MSNYAEAAENISAGKLRAVAAGSRARINSLPNVPTVSECSGHSLIVSGGAAQNPCGSEKNSGYSSRWLGGGWHYQ
jgi:tRNA(Phe) wybutosine-synthesizing methylase Tyw3